MVWMMPSKRLFLQIFLDALGTGIGGIH